jgi:hypothetical protein
MLKVSLSTNKTGRHVKRRTWWPVLLVFNDTFNNVSGITYNMVTIFIGINATVTDIMLKVSLSTNKTGLHVIRYTWHIVESVVKRQ